MTREKELKMDFKDYYKMLGVEREASQETIKKAFRKLARECHPDHAAAEHKESAEQKFKEINEAYEVLGDPAKRRKYDALGAEWKAHAGAGANQWQAGQDFFRQQSGRASTDGFEYHFGGTGFSDFFEQFFADAEEPSFGRDPAFHRTRSFRGGPGFGRPGAASAHEGTGRGHDIESEILVTFEEALEGSVREISLQRRNPETSQQTTETVRVRLPPGVREGQRIRVAGKGSPGASEPGDLFLRVHYARHPDFRVEENHLVCDIDLAPWEAVLGCSVSVPSLEGSVRIRVPSGTQGGRKLRLRGRGLPLGKNKRSDLLAHIRIRVPETLSQEERTLWEKLAQTSGFNPGRSEHS